MPLDTSMAHYGVQDRPVADRRRDAMDRALAAFGAAGDADRRAAEMTVPFCPPLQTLRRRWLMYAWATRSDRESVPHFRALLRNAVACYRALRDGGRL